jgi:hypothetical protein
MNRWALLFLPLLAGCTTTISDAFHGGAWVKRSDWFETGEVRKPREEIARTVREQLLRQGFTPPEFDQDQRLETPWDVHVSPRFREGYRTKIEAEIVPVGAGGYNVRVRSTMEIDNSDHSGMIETADWIGAGASEKHKARISDEAVKLNSTLKLRFFGLNP